MEFEVQRDEDLASAGWPRIHSVAATCYNALPGAPPTDRGIINIDDLAARTRGEDAPDDSAAVQLHASLSRLSVARGGAPLTIKRDARIYAALQFARGTHGEVIMHQQAFLLKLATDWLPDYVAHMASCPTAW